MRECLEFAARLKLPGTEAQKQAKVDEVIHLLRLTKCQHTKVGGPTIKGISGGEKKRTTIGIEMLTDPMLLFLDEPTTGLDSYTAFSVIYLLRDLARSGRTIITTIHQPSSETYELFDRLLLMANGKIVYFNEAKLAVGYFSSINYVCPDESNPADFFMNILSIENLERA